MALENQETYSRGSMNIRLLWFNHLGYSDLNLCILFLGGGAGGKLMSWLLKALSKLLNVRCLKVLKIPNSYCSYRIVQDMLFL